MIDAQRSIRNASGWRRRVCLAVEQPRKLTLQVSLSTVDQGLFSGANFILNMWLVQVLSAEGYGRFAVAFALFLLMAGAYNSFVLEPISLLGSSVSDDVLPEYFGMIVWMHLLVSVIISASVLVCLTLLPSFSIGPTIMVMAALCPMLLLWWLSRRLAYVLLMPIAASFGSAAYFVSLLATVYAFAAVNRLNETTAFAATAVASVAASLVMLWRVPVIPRYRPTRTLILDLRNLLTDHWLLGRWVALQTLFNLGSAHLPIFVAGIGISVSTAGMLRALSLVIMPLQQVIMAVGGMLVLPLLSREYSQGNIASVRRKTKLLSLGFISLAGANLLVLVVLRHIISDFLPHDGELFSDWLIPAVGVSALVGAVGGGAGLALRATRKVAYYPLSTAIPALYGIIMTPLMILQWGITGAVINSISIAMVACLLNIILYRRWV